MGANMRTREVGRWWGVFLLVLGSLGAGGGEAAGRDDALVDAVKAADTVAAHALLQQGHDVDAREADGTTALHWAVYRDDQATVELLIRADADVRAANRYGVEPLSLAAVNGNAAIIDTLLKAGASPNTAMAGGETALMTAARTGRVEAVKVLVAHGADVNAQEDAKGQTALMWAAAENNAAVVAALIEAGAALDARSIPSRDLSRWDPPGGRGFTALLFAARAGQIDAARVLLTAGADVNDTLSNDALSDSEGTSALLLAVVSAQFDMAAFLLDNGADPNAAEQGWTALHQMAWTRRPNRGLNTVGPVATGEVDSLTLVRKLVEHGADLDARVTKEIPNVITGRNNLNRIGSTAFLLAAHRVDVEYMRLLAELGADPLLPNEDGTSPLMVAAGVGLWFPGESPGTPEEVAEAVALGLELGGAPTAVDANGDTALHGAAYWDSPGAIELLVEAGAKLDATNQREWTPLRIADGVAITASLHVSPVAAVLLRRLLRERGLPVPEAIIGDAGR